MPRSVRIIALVLAFLVSGAPAWAAEVMRDDCADDCDGNEPTSCPERGCTDCSLLCPACPRAIAVIGVALRLDIPTEFVRVASTSVERVPDDPISDGVFHPPRSAG